MVTETIATSVASIPSSRNWADSAASKSIGTDEILFLEKATDGRVSIEDIGKALNEYKRLYKAGIASPAEMLTLSRAYPEETKYSNDLQKMGISDDDSLVIGGPASIELVDREGHLITTNALHKAFTKYMANFRTRNAMVLHSDVQVGWALPAYISKGGQIFKSGVDDKGLFFITELRNDTKIAKKVMEQIHEGKLKSYSIAGSAVKTQNIQKDMQDVMQVDELELAEVTVCEKGVNQGAAFDILKAENAATKSCIDGSCLINKEDACDCGCKSEVELMYKSDGDIDFTKSFFSYIQKEGLEGESFPTLMNTQGRQAEHHQLLDEYGFPAELEPENARYTPVVELDLAHSKPPWVVNEAGQSLGERYYEDALTTPQLAPGTKRGVAEGANSTETPVKQLNITDSFNNVLTTMAKDKAEEEGHPWYSPEIEVKITKSQDFFNWMDSNNHMYKESCPCEYCFQKTADYKGTVEKPFLALAVDNPFAVATAQAKKLGHSDFSEGSKGDKKRGEIAEALKKSSETINEIAFLLKLKMPFTSSYKKGSKYRPSDWAMNPDQMPPKKEDIGEGHPGKLPSFGQIGDYSDLINDGEGRHHSLGHANDFSVTSGSRASRLHAASTEDSKQGVAGEFFSQVQPVDVYGRTKSESQTKDESAHKHSVRSLASSGRRGFKSSDHLYIKREPKAGGGWKYTYPDDVKTTTSPSMTPEDHEKQAMKHRVKAGGKVGDTQSIWGEDNLKSSSHHEAAHHHEQMAAAKRNAPRILAQAKKAASQINKHGTESEKKNWGKRMQYIQDSIDHLHSTTDSNVMGEEYKVPGPQSTFIGG